MAGISRRGIKIPFSLKKHKLKCARTLLDSKKTHLPHGTQGLVEERRCGSQNDPMARIRLETLIKNPMIHMRLTNTLIIT